MIDPRHATLRAAREVHRKLLFPLLSVLFPTPCFVCGLPLGPRQRLGACIDCWAELEPVRSPVCVACGFPLPRSTDLLGPARGRCAGCLSKPPSHGGVRAAVLYEGIARTLLLRAKFGGRREIFLALGAHLSAVLAASGFARGCTVVVPVPSHPWPLLRRGFSPALEIARPVARSLELPLRPGLLRRRWRVLAAVKRLGVSGRRAALRRAFRAPSLRTSPRVLLVDDVLTTGATAEACAGALLAAGAAEIRIAVWARTPRQATAFDRPRQRSL